MTRPRHRRVPERPESAYLTLLLARHDSAVAGDRLAGVNSLDARSPALAAVQEAYGTRSAEYIDLFGSADKASTDDRAVITAWAKTVVGPVLDAGCGPGHWSAFLQSLGLHVEGIDATAAFVEHASRAHPTIPFRLGDLRTLDLAPDSLGGALAWFSLIHLHPGEVPHVIDRFSTALRPGGTLLIGYFSGPELQPFDHAVVTAWTWPPLRMQHLLEAAGLEVLTHRERPQASGRVFAELTARRPLQATKVKLRPDLREADGPPNHPRLST